MKKVWRMSRQKDGQTDGKTEVFFYMLGCENENKESSYCEALKYVKQWKKVVSLSFKLTNLLSLQIRFPKSGPTYRSQVVNPNAARAISCKAWNSPVEYPSTECKHDIKESERNMFNPIFKENVQGRKHTGSCASAEPELLSYKSLNM